MKRDFSKENTPGYEDELIKERGHNYERALTVFRDFFNSSGADKGKVVEGAITQGEIGDLGVSLHKPTDYRSYDPRNNTPLLILAGGDRNQFAALLSQMKSQGIEVITVDDTDQYAAQHSHKKRAEKEKQEMQRLIENDNKLREAMVANYQAAKQTVEEFFGPSNVRDYEGHVGAENDAFSVMLVRPRGGTAPGSNVPILLILHGSPEDVKALQKIMDDKNIVCTFKSVNEPDEQTHH